LKIAEISLKFEIKHGGTEEDHFIVLKRPPTPIALVVVMANGERRDTFQVAFKRSRFVWLGVTEFGGFKRYVTAIEHSPSGYYY